MESNFLAITLSASGSKPHLIAAFFLLAVTSGWSQNSPNQPQFNDPVPPSSSTTAPKKIHDDYWHGQFERVNKAVAEAKDTKVIFFGDSITWMWSLDKAQGKPVWERDFGKYNPINMGNSGDITPVMIYRANHGNLDFPKGQAPTVAVLLCGTNNYAVSQSAGGKVKWDLGLNTDPGEVAQGVRAVAQAIRRESPETRVLLLGILPVSQPEKWRKCKESNRILATYNYPKDEVVFLNLESHFTNQDGTIKSDLFTDGTHLTEKGYEVMGAAILPHIERLVALGPIPTEE